MAQDALQFSDSLSIQLKFLNDAAHLMAVNVPACSSHIMSNRDTIMSANDIELSESHRRHVCGGCGTIKVPAWTVELAKETKEGRRKRRMTKGQLQKLKERATKSIPPGAMVDFCKRCGRKTHQSILNRAPQRNRQRQAPPSRPSILNKSTLPPFVSTPTSSTTVPTASTNTSSKKRAKSRRQGGLQALLAKNKEASQAYCTMPRWWKRKREEQDAELALNMMARPGGPALPREYMPGIYGEPSANPQRWTTVDTPGMPPATYYGPTMTNQYGQRMRPISYQKPPKLKEKDMRRYWVKAAPPPPGTRVLLQDAPILGTNPYARVHIDGSLPPPGSIPVEYHGPIIGEQVQERDVDGRALRPEEFNDSSYDSRGHVRSPVADSFSAGAEFVPVDYYGPNYGGLAVPRLEQPNLGCRSHQGAPYPSAPGQYPTSTGSALGLNYGPTQEESVWAHGMGYTAPLHEQSNQSYYASQAQPPPSTAFSSTFVPGSMPVNYYGPTPGGRAEERDMGYVDRSNHLYHASRGQAHPTLNGPSPSTPSLRARRRGDRPRTSGSSSCTVYLTPRSQNRSPAPGDQDYVSTIDLTFPKSSKRQVAKEKARNERHGYTLPVRDPETIAVPMNPKTVHGRSRRTDRNASEFTSGRSSHLSEVMTHEGLQAEIDFEGDAGSPPSMRVVTADRVQIPTFPRLDIAQDLPADAADTASLESGLSLDGGVEGVLVEDQPHVPEKPKLRDMFGSHHKSLQPRGSHEDRSCKKLVQVASETVINSTQGDPNKVKPKGQLSSELSESGSPFATPDTLQGSTEHTVLRGLSYNGRAHTDAAPFLAGRILRDEVPLPQAVESLRLRRRPDLVDPGGQSSHVSSSLQGEPTTASSYTSVQSAVNSVGQSIPQVETTAQPWANIIPIPRNSRVEGTNLIRTLNHLHGENRQQPTVRVMALPSAIRTAGARGPNHEYTGPIGSANGPPLRVMQIPDEVNVEYYEQIAVRRPATTKRRVIQ